MSLTYKTRKILKDSVISTILKYSQYIDWTPIADKNVLDYRYFCVRLMHLLDDKKERTKKHGMIKK